MSFTMKYAITKDYLPLVKSGRRQGLKASKIKFIVLHDVGNNGANNNGTTAAANINYYKNSKTALASAHTFIDDKFIYECIPATTGTPEKAWHVLYNKTVDNKMFGADANDASIGVELCYFPKDKARSTEAYNKFVWYCAYLAYYFKLDPTKCFVGHETLDPGRKSDPSNGLKWIGKTTAGCIKDIIAEYNACTGKKAVKGVTVEAQRADRENQIGIATVVQKEALNVRKEALASSCLVKTLPSGSSWRVYETKDGFHKVGEGMWISSNPQRTKFEKVLPFQKAGEGPIGTVTILADSLNVRKEDDVKSPVVSSLKKGGAYKVYKEGKWGYNVGSGWIAKGSGYTTFKGN